MLHLGPPSQHTARLVDSLRETLKSATEWPRSSATPANSLTGVADWSPDGLLLLTAATSLADDRKLRLWGLDAVLASSGTPSCTDLEVPSALLGHQSASLFGSSSVAVSSGSGSGPGSAASAAAVRLIAWPTPSVASHSVGSVGRSTPSITGADLYSSAQAIAAKPEPHAFVPSSTKPSQQANPFLLASSAAKSPAASALPSSSSSSAPSTKPLPCNSHYDGCITASHAGHLLVWDFRQPRGVLAPARLPATPLELALISRNAPEVTPNPRPSADHALVSVSGDMHLRLFDARNLVKPVTEKKLPGYVSRARVDPYGPYGPRALVGYHGGLLEALSLAEGAFGQVQAQVQAQVGPCSVMDVDPLQRYVATSGQDSIVNLYDWERLEPVRTCRFDDDLIVRDLAFNHDGELLSVVSEGNTVSSFSVESGLRAFTTSLPTGNSLARMRWHPTRNVAVASYAMPRTVKSSKLVLFSH